MSFSPAKRTLDWQPHEDKVVRVGVKNHISNRILAEMLDRSEDTVRLRVLNLKLRQPKPVGVRTLSEEPVPIAAATQREMLKWIEKLGQLKLASMPPLPTREAYDFLMQHQDKLDNVPGARRLFERLNQHFK